MRTFIEYLIRHFKKHVLYSVKEEPHDTLCETQKPENWQSPKLR